MNKFYQQPKVIQWLIATIMMLMMFALMGVWFEIMELSILTLPTIFILVPLFQFLGAPFFTLTGMYQYLSPMLLVFGANDKKYDLHNGTSFDYLFVMRKIKPGIEMRKKMLSYYLEGLLKVVEKIETKELPEEITVRGSSYFFSERTAERLGFKLSKTNWAEKFNILLNYLDLLWMYSASQGKLAFPSIVNTKTAAIAGKDLVTNKDHLFNLYAYLKRAKTIQ